MMLQSTASTITHRPEARYETVIEIEGCQYYLANCQRDFITGLRIKPDSIVPALIISTSPGDEITRGSLQRLRKEYLDKDDVFQPAFCTTVIFYGSGEDEVDLSHDAANVLATWNTKDWAFVPRGLARPAPGPHVLFQGHLWQPWRIYEDYGETLMLSFQPVSLETRRYVR